MDIDTKEAIVTEMTRWMAHDRAYTETLIAYGKGLDLFSDDECKAAKAHIAEYYKNDDTVKETRAKYMGKVLDRIGFLPTKVLWRLIDQLPQRLCHGLEVFEFVPNNEAIHKALKIDSIKYYGILDQLIDLGYIYRLPKGIIGIDFLQIMAEGDEQGVVL